VKVTYRTESDGCGSQAYQASVACMRLMDGISEVVAELVKHGFDSGIILGMDKFADNALKPVKVSTMFKCETDPLYPVPRPPSPASRASVWRCQSSSVGEE